MARQPNGKNRNPGSDRNGATVSRYLSKAECRCMSQTPVTRLYFSVASQFELPIFTDRLGINRIIFVPLHLRLHVGRPHQAKRNERPGHRSRNYPERSAVGSVGKNTLSPQTTEGANPRYWERP